ncbi:MAG: hypothetical protein FJ150_09020, partial [Euryarchaeota archaeon]|nr:hypothetical protein [Euryarchaeota archaeon]
MKRGGNNSKEIFFWEKSALKPDDENKDELNVYNIESDPQIREVIRDLESKTMGKKLLFSEVSPKNPSVKKWISKIRDDYPGIDNNVVEDLLNTFRESLYPRSKEKYRLIVGLLLLRDIMVLVHCKKDPSLAEMKDQIYPVRLILHPKNVLRATIIKKENGKTTFSAFEHSKKWSKGHAEFWAIEPEDVNWESLGNILFEIELESFKLPVQLPIEKEDLDEMIKDNDISHTGNIRIGREDGKIIRVYIFRTPMEFPDFYDYYIREKEQLDEHKRKFDEIIYPNSLYTFDQRPVDKYKYQEDKETVFELTNGRNFVHNKKHLRFNVCFFTRLYPGIKPTQKLISTLYKSIFENYNLELWHPGEKTSLESINIGGLHIFNEIDINKEVHEFSETLLNTIQDAESKKTKFILQYYFCEFWKSNIENQYIKDMFEFLEESIIIP